MGRRFRGGGFASSTFFLGSGATVYDDKIIFSTPGHPLERLYRIEVGSKTFVSNSLPFILVTSESQLDLNYYGYESDFAEILKGINDYKKSVPLKSGRKLHLHYMSNFEWSNGNINELGRSSEEPFLNFDDYQSRLQIYINKLSSNAKDSKRRISYGLGTTVSSGYDAAACAVLAQGIGCTEAVSFNSPKKYENDNGSDITNALKYEQVIYRSASEYLKNKEFIEAEYCSSGELGTGIVFSSFDDIWPRKIVFMGERGDKIWARDRLDVNDELRVANELYAGTSMVESRLRVGYILCPLPLFGALQWRSVSEISRSSEMTAYSVGGNYDRPIPRRIIEESGVPRNVFGQSKSGAGFNYRFDTRARLKNRMSEKSYNSFIDFCKKHERWDVKKLQQYLRFFWFYKAIYLKKFIAILKLPISVKSPVIHGHVSNPGAPSGLFKWGVSVMCDRYKRALKTH